MKPLQNKDTQDFQRVLNLVKRLNYFQDYRKTYLHETIDLIISDHSYSFIKVGPGGLILG